MDVGPAELLIVLAVVLLLFGSKKLPELARGMGQASKEFRKGLHLGADEEEAEEAVEQEAQATTAPSDTSASKPGSSKTSTDSSN
jgi:sec-independent protein translocase protein TatA